MNYEYERDNWCGTDIRENYARKTEITEPLRLNNAHLRENNVHVRENNAHIHVPKIITIFLPNWHPILWMYLSTSTVMLEPKKVRYWKPVRMASEVRVELTLTDLNRLFERYYGYSLLTLLKLGGLGPSGGLSDTFFHEN